MLDNAFADRLVEVNKRDLNDLMKIVKLSHSGDLFMNVQRAFKAGADEIEVPIYRGHLSMEKILRELKTLRNIFNERGYNTNLIFRFPEDAKYSTDYEGDNIYFLRIERMRGNIFK